jgi:23S rRNA (adenine2503-C2)-methyltransferase
MDSVQLSGLSSLELEELVDELGHKRYRGRQLFEQLHTRLALTLDAIAVLPVELRRKLMDRGALPSSLSITATQKSRDGTVKLALRTSDNNIVETVLIPMDTGKHTQCLSSQVGCALGCKVCMTASLGFTRNLTVAEIIDQHRIIRSLYPDRNIRNLVFMGMGEPLLNTDSVINAINLMGAERGMKISPHRITISTSGIIPGIQQLGRKSQVSLAVSLNAPDQETREQLMPVARKYPLDKLMSELRNFPLRSRQRLTLEYVLVRSVNDSPDHARQLIRLVSGLRCKINLIPFNPFPGSTMQAPSEDAISGFLKILAGKHLTATVRRSKGADIQAACGQLAGHLGTAPAKTRKSVS